MRAPFIDGQHVESGAEWIDTHHHRMRELLACHGMELEGEGQQWTTIRRWLHRDGRLHSPAELGDGARRELARFEAIVHDAATMIDDPAQPQQSTSAHQLDARSLADVAQEAGLDDVALLFQRRDSQGEFAAEPVEVSLLFVAQQRAVSAAAGSGETIRAHRVAGGLDTLIGRMAAGIADAISINESLLSVGHDGSSAVVTTSRRTLRADHVVLACSLVAVRAVEFDPPLPSALDRAIRELGYGTVTKTAVQFAQRQWPEGYATTDGVSQRIYEPTAEQGGTAGALMSYAGGDGGRRLAEMTELERLGIIESDMRRVHQITTESTGGFSRAWSAEPRYGGSYAAYGPGQVTAFWDVLRRPCGRIWLCGEHVATWTGYLEGAVESGERVADGIHAAG